jgi:xanthine dehydrogenase molybdopterin-binding subunit B
VPGANLIGDIVLDEEIFATDRVVNVGQPIACIVAGMSFADCLMVSFVIWI